LGKAKENQVPMILYHLTHDSEANFRDGFRDEEGSYMLEDYAPGRVSFR
jgi:hypothetical protein